MSSVIVSSYSFASHANSLIAECLQTTIAIPSVDHVHSFHFVAFSARPPRAENGRAPAELMNSGTLRQNVAPVQNSRKTSVDWTFCRETTHVPT